MSRLTQYEITLLEQLDKQIDKSENQELCYQFLSLKIKLVKYLNQQEINLRALELEEQKLDEASSSYRPYRTQTDRSTNLF